TTSPAAMRSATWGSNCLMTGMSCLLANTAPMARNNPLSGPPQTSHFQQDGHRTVVLGEYLHICPKLPVLHRKAPRPALLHEPLIEGNGRVRLGRPGKARTAGGGVGV